MKLWLISQDVNRNYDTYDSAVVAAEDEDSARATHPGGFIWMTVDEATDWFELHGGRYWASYGSDWAEPGSVTVKLIGEATSGTERGVICASFNAG